MKALLVDDEAPARDRLSRKLAVYRDIAILGEAANGVEALEKIESLRPDVVFLDVDMPELDGLGVARSLPSDGPKIVFVTAYDEYAVKAFETSATDFLVKPVSDDRLRKTIERLRQTPQAKAPRLDELPPSRAAIRCGNRYVVIDPSRIAAILSRDHYSAVLVEGKEFLVEESLDAVAQRFRGVTFLRVHRGGIVNLQAISELVHQGDRKYLAVLNDPPKTKVPISRERLEDVKRALGL